MSPLVTKCFATILLIQNASQVTSSPDYLVTRVGIGRAARRRRFNGIVRLGLTLGYAEAAFARSLSTCVLSSACSVSHPVRSAARCERPPMVIRYSTVC